LSLVRHRIANVVSFSFCASTDIHSVPRAMLSEEVKGLT